MLKNEPTYALTLYEIVALMHSSYAEGAVTAIVASETGDERYLAVRMPGAPLHSPENAAVDAWIIGAAKRIKRRYRKRLVQANA